MNDEQKDYPFFDQLHDIDDLLVKQLVRIPVTIAVFLIGLGVLWGICAVIGWALWHLPKWLMHLMGN